MKVKMFTLYCGEHGIIRPGEVFDCGAEEAKQLIEGGFAEEIELNPAKATAKVELTEKARNEIETTEGEEIKSRKGRKGK